MKKIGITSLALVVSLSISAQLKDMDKNEYKIVAIGEQEWMAENLSTTKFTDKEKIPLAQNENEWEAYCDKKQPCYSYYNFNEENKKLGLVYNFYAAHSDKLAPEGWHVPDTDDWTTLVFEVGAFDKETAMKLKDENTWTKGGENSSGFSAKVGGCMRYCGAYTDISEYKSVSYWRIDEEREENGTQPCSFGLSESDEYLNVSLSYTFGPKAGYYVRCVKSD